MNPKLEQLDLEILSAIQRDRQAEMAREAQTSRALGGSRSAGYGARAFRKLVIVVSLLAPIALWLVRAAEAAGAGGGGGGFVHHML